MKLRKWQADCINQAFERYYAKPSHFLCLATPGAGKTMMAAQLAKKLFDSQLIDLVICFSPSVIVAHDFQAELEAQTRKRLDGTLGAAGHSTTYQGMLSLSDDFWRLLVEQRTFVIFDEIHHCSGDELLAANAWGERILSKIQGKATYTLALTGTPWRSDHTPIALSRYCDQKLNIHCDYRYGLADAIKDGVCRTPLITLVDNDDISLTSETSSESFSSFTDLFENTDYSYQSLVENEDLLKALLTAYSAEVEHPFRRKMNTFQPLNIGL